SCAANVGNRAPRRKRFRCRESRKCARGFLARATRVILPRATEGWPSGLRRTLGKRVCGKPYRGFESHSLRHLDVRLRSLTFRNLAKYPLFLASFGFTRSQPFAIIRSLSVDWIVDENGANNRQTHRA